MNKVFGAMRIRLFLCLLQVNIVFTSLFAEDFDLNKDFDNIMLNNQLLTQIELHFFADNLSSPDQLQDIIALLKTHVSPGDADKKTLFHFLYARSLYLSALVLPDHTFLTDIYQAVLIEEALIPFINTLNYNTTLTPEEKSLWKTVAVSFYLTQAHYNFLGQNRPSQAIAPLQIALSLNPTSLFILYQLAGIHQHLPNTSLSIDPTKELENLLDHPHTTATERSLIYLMLATLLPTDYNHYMTYAHIAWLAATRLGETQESFTQYLDENLPKPLHPNITYLFVDTLTNT